MQTSFDESIRMVKALSADVEYCYEQEDSQFWRRTFIRSAFAFVECFIFRMKQEALDIHNLEGNIFGEAELAFLKEVDSYDFFLNNKGEAQTQVRKRFIPLESNFKFTIKAYARAYGLNSELDLGDGGWKSFKSALQVRHRLTHPKHFEQIDVSDEEKQNIEDGLTWFRKVTLEVLKKGKIT